VENVMPKRKADIDVGRRAYKECDRIFGVSEYGGIIKAIKALGCNKKAIYGWKDGLTPETFYLIRLHYLGADVMYILTGVRNKK
jgi:hypothetical protein